MLAPDFTLRSNEIRSCCNACAVAKVKCTKVKPSCRRCVRRGHICFHAIAMRQGRPRQVSQERRNHQDLHEFQTGSNIQQPLPSPVLGSFSDIDYGIIATQITDPCISNVPTNMQPMETVDLLSFNNTETSRLVMDPLLSSGCGGVEILQRYALCDQPPSAQTAPYDDFMLAREGQAAYGENGSIHQQWYNNSVLASTPPYNESVSGPAISGLAASTLVSVNEKLNDFHEPSQFAYETPNLTMEHTADHWICGCSAKIASLLQQLTPHGAIGVTRARDNALLCNLDAIVPRNEKPLRKVNGVLQCSCSFGVSVLLHLAAVMLKILGWYTAIIGIVMRCAFRFQAALANSAETFSWICEFFEPYDAGVDSAEQAHGYLQLISAKLETIRPIASTLIARLLAPGKRSTSGRSLLGHRLEDTACTLLRAGGLCGTLSCKSIAHAFDAELRCRFEDSWQLLMDALHSL